MTRPSIEPSTILVFVTYPSSDEALRVSSALVDEHLVACVNLITGVKSLFFWQGAREESEEVLAVAKTTLDRLDAVVKRVQSLHSYSVPEVIGIPVLGGSAEYLRWVRDSVNHNIDT